jgi:hypothetical protein
MIPSGGGTIGGMNSASLARYHPKLQGIFGRLDKSQDEYLRRVLAEVDAELARIATHFARHSVGLNMNWYESGQLSIGGNVGTSDSHSHAADFLVELWPSWMHEEPSRKNEWVIETSVSVDCQHVPDHESMDEVFNRQERRLTPESAVDELLSATRHLAALAMDNPIEYWTSKAKS